MASWALGVFRDRSKATMLTLYKSLIRCKVEYCCPLWDPQKVQDIQEIEEIQRHFTRRIAGCQDMDYWQRLKHLNPQSLQRRRERYSLIHMWKTNQKLVPNDLNIQFYDNKRLGTKIKIPKYSTSATTFAKNAYESSFAIRGAKLWNTLPQEVNSQNTLPSFKIALGRFLETFPDTPPTKGYVAVNRNSLLAWTTQAGGCRLLQRPC